MPHEACLSKLTAEDLEELHARVDSDVKCNIPRRYANAWRSIQKEMLPCQDTDI